MKVLERVPLLGWMWHDTSTGKRWKANDMELVAAEPCSGSGLAECDCPSCGARRVLSQR
jgi:hypothetical protein